MPFLGKLQNIFILIALIFGMAWLIIMPPFQSPDEGAHFLRAYGISQGSFMCINEGKSNAGSLLPANIEEFMNSFQVERIAAKHDQKYNINYTINSLKLSPSNEKQFVGYMNSCVYSPVSYFPQAMGFLLGNLVNAPFTIIFYLGRIFNLLTFIFLGYFIIKMLPKLKLVALLLLLMPMTLHQGSSLSPDVITITLCFFFVAYVLRIQYQPEQYITKNNILILTVLACIIGLLKITYFPISLVTLTIPFNKFKSKKYAIYINSLVILGSVICAVIWLVFTTFINIIFPVNPSDQIHIILNNPLSFIKLMLQSSLVNDGLFIQFFGNFGWLDTPSPLVLVIFYFAILFFVTIDEAMKNRDINKQKLIEGLISLFTFITCTILIQLSLYLNWPQTTPGTVSGVQGRYFIPISFIFFYSVYLLAPFLIKKKMAIFIVLISIVLLVSTYNIFTRYYHVGPDYELLQPYNNTHLPDGIQTSTNIRQSFIAEKNNLRGISVYISTFGKTVVSPYELVLYDSNNNIVAKSNVDYQKVQDNQFYEFLFNDSIKKSKNKRFSFTIKPLSNIVKDPITIQISQSDIYLDGEFSLDGNFRNDDIVFRLVY